MKKLMGTVLALAIALLTMLSGIAAARSALNRNQTVLRCVAGCGVILALMSVVPGIAAARTAVNHNQTLLRA
jgi:hypothetical protein